jgi:hypothetical protein
MNSAARHLGRRRAGWLLGGLTLAGCHLAPRAAHSSALEPRTAGPEVARLPAELEEPFASLRSAVAAGEDQTAAGILARLLALELDGPTRELLLSYERLLRGRELASQVRLRLFCEPDSARTDGSAVWVWLGVAHELPEDLALSMPAARVGQVLEGIDEQGLFQVQAHNQPAEIPAGLRIPPGFEAQIDLGRFELPLGRGLAVQSEFRVALPAVELDYRGRQHLVRLASVPPARAQRVAPRLPPVALEPEFLLDYLRGSNVFTPALVERLVRIPQERREEALERVLASAFQVDRAVFERRYAPVLRWLSGAREQGKDQRAWESWAKARSQADPDARAGRLELPATAGAERP